MYLTHNAVISVVAERFIRTLKNKICKHILTVICNYIIIIIITYINKLDHIVDKYKNKYHRLTKRKHTDVKSSTYIDFDVENNDKDLKFKVGNHERISKYKKFLLNVTLQVGQNNFLWLKKLKNTAPWIYAINDLMAQKMLEYFMKKG